jgi:hypothetical protein
MTAALKELICDANREITPADRHAILDLIEQQAAKIAELSTCKLCNSTGHDTPCAYPTEINRQQAKRIAALESASKDAIRREALEEAAECAKRIGCHASIPKAIRALSQKVGDHK